jgi:hypothetical protein
MKTVVQIYSCEASSCSSSTEILVRSSTRSLFIPPQQDSVIGKQFLEVHGNIGVS